MSDGEILGPSASTAAQIVDSVDDGLAIFGNVDLDEVHLQERNVANGKSSPLTMIQTGGGGGGGGEDGY